MKKELNYLFKKVATYEDLKPNLPYQDKAEKRPKHIRNIAKTFGTFEGYDEIMRNKCKDKLILIR